MSKLMDSLRGARKVEYLALILLIALAVLFWAQNRAPDTGASTELERRMESTLSRVAGAGDVRVMIAQAEDGSVTGVLIVAEGAEDIKVYLALADAAETLLGVDANDIEIARMRGN
jgi:hypothetical protein